MTEREEAFRARFNEVVEELESRVVDGDPAFGCAVMFVASKMAEAMPPYGTEAGRSMLDLVQSIVDGLKQMDFPSTKGECDARMTLIDQLKGAAE